MSAQPVIEVSRERRLESIVRVDVRPDGVAVLSIADPAGIQNTITPAFASELTAALDLVAADVAVRAVVVRSAKKASFLAGANIDFVRSLRFAKDAEEASREIARRFDRLGALLPAGTKKRWRRGRPKPVVAFVHGPALGGGFELALACSAAVATDDASTVFGLPEVKLGLIPAGNGLFRIAARAGLRAALELGLSGRTLRADQARELGLIDEVVPPSTGFERAVELARRLADEPKLLASLRKQRFRSKGTERIARLVIDGTALGRFALFRHTRRTTLARTRGNYPAPLEIVDLLERFGSRGFASAAKKSSVVFGELVIDERAHRLMELFVARTALKKESGLEPNEYAEPHAVPRVGIVGAGVMGGAVAAACARAGCLVRLRETDDFAVERGLRHVRDLLESARRRGAISREASESAKSRLSGTTSTSALADSAIVFEAVLEDLAAKQKVVAEIGGVVGDACIVASCTSAIPITQIATSRRPERVIGMHYAAPFADAPLLEVVRAPRSDARTIATAVAFGKSQGKTVIVVRDGAGFYTTRIRVPLLNEALHLLSEGMPVDAIDAALLDWGFRRGPFQLFDEVGIDVCLHAAKIAQEAFGSSIPLPSVLAALHADGRKGRKNARGFYLHGTAAPRKRAVDDTVYRVIGIAPQSKRVQVDDIVLRCSLALVNEAFRCAGDGILRSRRDGDIGAILGVGFPAFRGGPFRYVDVVGITEVLRLMRTLEQRFGERFEPAPLLVDMARHGRRSYD